jgi:acetyl esterase/lipase
MKRHLAHWALLPFLLAAAPATKPTLPPAPDGVTILQDVPYLDPTRTEKLDLYLPTGRPPGTRSPAVLIIHGGGWVGGDKAASREFNIGTTLAKAGYVCASVNYYLGPAAASTQAAGKSQGAAAFPRWPTNLHDCKNAVRFLRARADEYGVDPANVGVIGGSAGGHLALMVGYTHGVPDLTPSSPYPDVSDRVSCVVNFYGITNILTRRRTAGDGTPQGVPSKSTSLLKVTADEDPAAWRHASPVFHVSADTPPTLIAHGTRDTTVDRDQAAELADKLKEFNVRHELILLPDIGHTFDLQTWSRKPLPMDLRPIVTRFFDSHLKAN